MGESLSFWAEQTGGGKYGEKWGEEIIEHMKEYQRENNQQSQAVYKKIGKLKCRKRKWFKKERVKENFLL